MSALKVLIVEDEVFVALELQSHLEAFGHRVVGTASTGEDAVAQAAKTRPDLILMDVRLDGAMDGIEAARKIRFAHDVPVVFITAFGDDATLARARKADPFGFLLKPFNERDLKSTLEVALDKFRRQHALQQSHDDLQQILDQLRIGTAMTDEAGRLVFLSRTAREVLGAETGTGLGQPWAEGLGVSAHTADLLQRQVEAVPAERERVPARIERPDGRRHVVDIDVQQDPRNPARHIFVLYDVTEVHTLRDQLHAQGRYHDLVGQSEGMRAVFQQIEAVGRVDTTVLIEGETGTGKELVARALHNASARKQKPFVAVNCAALTESLAASQLFGHKKGSFTGAVEDSKGYFGAADGGTLFLDEIGDIPLDVQVNLLRVLEQRQVVRVGETTPRPVDVRIVAASHRNLPREVEAGRFRADLLYRIRVARVDLPALRERPGDIPVLVRSFLQHNNARHGLRVAEVSQEAMRALLDYAWPGNVRELRNAIEYATIRAQDPILRLEDLPPEIRAFGQPTVPAVAAAPNERERILAALQHTAGNRKEAAELLGVSRATFYRRLTEYGLV